MDKGLTLIGLEIENVKAIRAIAIHPKAIGVVKLCGTNASGKSSVLDGIQATMGGKGASPELPIREGETSARSALDFGEFTVGRTWTETDSYLTVKYKDKKKVGPKRPQEFLDSLVGSGLAFDPAAFGDKDDAAQVKDLLACVKLPEDPRVIDQQIDLKYRERTKVNARVKELRAQAGGISIPEGTPEQEVSLTGLMQEHERILKQSSENTKIRMGVETLNQEIERINKSIADLEVELDTRRKRRNFLHDELSEAQEKVEGVVDPNPDDLKHQIQAIQETNQSVHLLQKRQSIEEDALGAEVDSNLLTAEIERLRKSKSDMLASAPFPVEGLSLEEHDGGYRLAFNGIPLRQCSSKERITVGMGIAMAANPDVRLILMRQASLLDSAAILEVERTCEERGFQAILEIVAKDDEELEGIKDAFIIRDGGIIGVPKE